MNKRGCGILLHISSLPSKFGIGDFGPSAYKFVDFLFDSGQKYWQILPLNPTDFLYFNSPYRSVSAFAMNPLFISPELLLEEGLLKKNDINGFLSPVTKFVDYESATRIKKKIWRRAFKYFKEKNRKDFLKFCIRNSYWLDDFALFTCLKDRFRKTLMFSWPQGIRKKNKKTLEALRLQLSEKIEKEKFLQYIAFKQYYRLKAYCNEKGIKIIGDLPIYVEYNSSDAWVNPEIFKLDGQKKPYAVAGVPPDYFSQKGQLWNNPVYDWAELKKTGYRWWINRFRHNFKLFDIVRVDHFRGFMGFWEVPYGKKSAICGHWRKAPGGDFFKKVTSQFSGFPIIAEDLGVITKDVKTVISDFRFPGTKVLLFAFSSDDSNPYLPHNIIKNSVVYTGTHDNNTTKGWLRKDATRDEKKKLFKYLGKEVYEQNINWEFIKMALNSKASIAILPMQDVLGLDERSRMNNPALKKGNWVFRLRYDQINRRCSKKIFKLVRAGRRAGHNRA